MGASDRGMIEKSNRSRGRTLEANFRESLAVSLLVRLIKTGRVWKDIVQTVCFLILKFNFPHFSMTCGYFYFKKALFGRN